MKCEIYKQEENVDNINFKNILVFKATWIKEDYFIRIKGRPTRKIQKPRTSGTKYNCNCTYKINISEINTENYYVRLPVSAYAEPNKEIKKLWSTSIIQSQI